MNPESTFDEYLEGEHGRGTSDGPGEFTISVQRALEQLSLHAAPEPRLYALAFVQWANSRQARNIKITISDSLFEMHDDGRSPENVHLIDLLMGTHFGRAVTGALGAGASEVVLESGDRRYCLPSGQQSECSPVEGTRVSFQLKVPWLERSPRLATSLRTTWTRLDMEGTLQQMILRSAGLCRPDVGLLRTFGWFSATPIQVNGKLINRPLFGLPCKLTQDASGVDFHCSAGKTRKRSLFHITSSQRTPGTLFVPTSNERMAHSTLWAAERHPAPPQAPLIWAPTCPQSALRMDHFTFHRRETSAAVASYFPDVSGDAVVSLLVDGVVVEEVVTRHCPPGLVVADASHLKTDLSGWKFIRDEDFQHFLVRLGEDFRQGLNFAQ